MLILFTFKMLDYNYLNIMLIQNIIHEKHISVNGKDSKVKYRLNGIALKPNTSGDITNICLLDTNANAHLLQAHFTKDGTSTFIGPLYTSNIIIGGEVDIIEKPTLLIDDTRFALVQNDEYEYSGATMFDIKEIKGIDEQKKEKGLTQYEHFKDDIITKSLIYTIVGSVTLCILGHPEMAPVFLGGGITNQIYQQLLYREIDTLDFRDAKVPKASVGLVVRMGLLTCAFLYMKYNIQPTDPQFSANLLLALAGFMTGKVAMYGAGISNDL